MHTDKEESFTESLTFIFIDAILIKNKGGETPVRICFANIL